MGRALESSQSIMGRALESSQSIMGRALESSQSIMGRALESNNGHNCAHKLTFESTNFENADGVYRALTHSSVVDQSRQVMRAV
jgi:hypothetical protein